MTAGTFYDLEPGQLPDDDLLREFAIEEARIHLLNWRRTGNGAHAWRAWRCARLLPRMPADVQRVLFEYLDLVSRGLVVADSPTGVAQSLRMSHSSGAAGEGNNAASEQESTFYILARYTQLLDADKRKGRAPNKSAAERQIAKECRTTPGAIHQKIIRAKGKRR